MAIVYFSKPAEHDLKYLPKSAVETIRKELIRFQTNLRIGKPLHGPLRGYFSFDFWSAGVSYRCAYELAKDNILVLMVDTRDNFYKKFARRVR
ncbi:MAG: type II toxin-antitoxin system RelE/ParE family toxin [Parcubacteria group bacterium]|nr:type II toxin-antitoxin system RelE/ParE family toxin [Parcubacteria group bacterium]